MKIKTVTRIGKSYSSRIVFHRCELLLTINMQDKQQNGETMKHDKENREISTVNLDFLINALFNTKQRLIRFG
jgi:hypothetical protein